MTRPFEFRQPAVILENGHGLACGRGISN
jgi:hypothetical protein